jgi:hypothetical protein
MKERRREPEDGSKLGKDGTHTSGWSENQTTPATTSKRSKNMIEGDSHIHPVVPELEGPSDPHQRLSSRRSFLGGSAKLLGAGALALGLGAAPAFAKG